MTSFIKRCFLSTTKVRHFGFYSILIPTLVSLTFWNITLSTSFKLFGTWFSTILRMCLKRKNKFEAFKKHKSLGLTYDQVYRIYSNIRIHLSLKTNKSVKFPFVKENALLTRIVLYLSLRAFFPHVALHEDHSVHSLITHRTFGKCFAG